MTPNDTAARVCLMRGNCQVIRDALEAAVEGYNPKKEVVLLVRARCGYMAVVVMPLVPELAVCRLLGVEYAEKDALQLNLDN